MATAKLETAIPVGGNVDRAPALGLRRPAALRLLTTPPYRNGTVRTWRDQATRESNRSFVSLLAFSAKL